VKRIDETAYGSIINQPFQLGACGWMRQTGTDPSAGDRTGSGNGYRSSPDRYHSRKVILENQKVGERQLGWAAFFV